MNKTKTIPIVIENGDLEVKYRKKDGTPVYGRVSDVCTIPKGATAAGRSNKEAVKRQDYLKALKQQYLLSVLKVNPERSYNLLSLCKVSGLRSDSRTMDCLRALEKQGLISCLVIKGCNSYQAIPKPKLMRKRCF